MTDAPNPRTQATAAGWKMVPVEPTPEMASVIEVNRMFGPKAEFTYRAILAAAPPPPADIGGEGTGEVERLVAEARAEGAGGGARAIPNHSFRHGPRAAGCCKEVRVSEQMLSVEEIAEVEALFAEQARADANLPMMRGDTADLVLLDDCDAAANAINERVEAADIVTLCAMARRSLAMEDLAEWVVRFNASEVAIPQAVSAEQADLLRHMAADARKNAVEIARAALLATPADGGK